MCSRLAAKLTRPFTSCTKPGDKVLGMISAMVATTHGSPVNLSGTWFEFVHYGVRPDTETIDYDHGELAKKHRPRMIIAGASAYLGGLIFLFREIADQVGAYLMVDMAHIAGLVAGGMHDNPVPYANFVTTTTHKTLRGRGRFDSDKEEHARAIDKAIFPGIQGGPLMHIIAAKAVALKEALQPEFKEYARAVVDNAQALAEGLKNRGFTLISDGTDNHLILVNVKKRGFTGKDAEKLLDEVGITVNKNTIPFETESPFVTSGIRLGTAALTTRGMGRTEMEQIADIISQVLNKEGSALEMAKHAVREIALKFPLYESISS